MNTKQKILMALVVCLTAFISCKKANTTPSNPQSVPQSVSAMVAISGGSPFSWQTTSVSSSNSGRTLLITATNSDGTSMVIKMPYPVVLGSNYTQNWQTYNIVFNVGGGTYQPSLGQVGVTSHANGVLVGTFSGTMYNYNVPTGTSPEIDITNGAFTTNVQ